jgi:hypothetical protein
VTFADFRQELAGDHPYRRRAFDEFFVRPAVERAYLEITGKLIAAH